MSNKNICFCIVFNHRYDKNISKLRDVYGSRFSNIYFIMPYYNGSDSSVINVTNTSFTYEGYFAIVYDKLKDKNFTHFIFCGDDFILRDDIDEENILQIFNAENSPYIDSIDNLTTMSWSNFADSVNCFSTKNVSPALNYVDFSKAGESLLNRKNLLNNIFNSSIDFKRALKSFYLLNNDLKKKFLRCLLKSGETLIDQPVYYGFSDFIIVQNENMGKFVEFCACFAAVNMWVEAAIPTALKCCTEKISTFDEEKYEKLILWGDDRNKLLNDCDASLNILYEKMKKEDILYAHPIKLSAWKE